MRRRRSLGGGFSPLKLFVGGVAGAWYDPSDYSTLFQDSAGTTPVTAVEQPVGLMLDKSQGLVLGNELINLASFPAPTITDVTGTVGVWNAATLTMSNTGSTVGGYPRFQFNLGLVVGRTYFVSGVLSGSTTQVSQIRLATGGAANDIPYNTATGVFSGRIVAAATSLGINTDLNGAESLTITSLSIRELSGNHASQATAGSRPTLSARYNILLATETLATQSVTTVATTYKLSFTGAGSITLSGTATGTYSAGTNTITCTAGSLTLTVSGTVSQADLRLSSMPTSMPAYQRVTTATDYATTGFFPYLAFDGTADFLGAAYVQSAYPLTITAGVENTIGNAGTGIVAVTQGDFQFKQLRDDATSITASQDRNATVIVPTVIAASGSKFCLSQFETSLITHQVNGGTATTIANTNAFGTSANIFVGKTRPSGLFSPARNYGVVITNTVLTADQKNSLKNWMGGKMGVSL